MDRKIEKIYGKIVNKRATVCVPGSKSITARAILLAALARGTSTLYNAQFSDDCAVFCECIKKLGIRCEREGTTLTVEGCGGVLPVKKAELNVGSAGTAARFLTALLAFSEGEFKVDSSAQMKRRPIKPLTDSLEGLGARIGSDGGAFPLSISGKGVDSASLTVDVTESSQFLSAVLMAAACARGRVKIVPSGSHGRDYVDMTLGMMWSFGLPVKEEGGAYIVEGGYSAKKYDIEPDVSAACYFYAANRILGTDISVRGVMPHSMQGDTKFIDLIKNFDGGEADMSSFSDQALTLAAIAPFFGSPTVIKNVAHIRRQECDRIAAIAYNLGAMGVRCEELPDGVKIYPSEPRPARIKTFGDHRVAMAFALTGLRADGIVIEDAGVCTKTFAEYFDVWDKLSLKLTK